VKIFSSVPHIALAVSLLVGCASTKVSNREEYIGGELPRPARIIVYDFAVTPEDLPAWSGASSGYPRAEASADDLEAGRKLGAKLAEELVDKINDMGMTAVRSANQPGPQRNDLAIAGYFSSIDKGSAAERVVVGFGKGGADVKAHVAAYRKTDEGMVRLGSGDVDAGGGGKSPGLIVPALVTVATANPIGLAVGGAVKAEGEISGRSTDVGSAKRIADEIAKRLKIQFERQGWI
jgi:hypothetical protein